MREHILVYFIIFVLSYIIFTYKYGVTNNVSDNMYIIDTSKDKDIFFIWKDFKNFYSSYVKAHNFVFIDEKIRYLREDSYNKDFNKDYYLTNEYKKNINKETSQLNNTNFIQDTGILRLKHLYKEYNTNNLDKIIINDEYYCPGYGVKQWTRVSDHKWLCLILQPANNSTVWLNYLNNFTKHVHRIRVTREICILLDCTNPHEYFWYSIDGGTGVGARVLELFLDDEFGKQLSQ